MPYLIDGHNLIGQLPDIELDDPNDEAKLVLKLRSFASRVGNRVTVIFDNGLPAGDSTRLSTYSVQVRFASGKSTADRVMQNMIRKVKDPDNWIVISSDIEVRALAEQCGMRCITSHDFVAVLNQPRKKKPSINRQKNEPRLSKAEVDEWLRLFGAEKD